MRCLPGAVRCPGDPEKACEEEARARGVVLHEGTATALKALAGRYGVGETLGAKVAKTLRARPRRRGGHRRL